ncbi:MAG: hypothetical protein K2Q20_01515 [Phycisphaerales bacterium]|nr:hypothetical protein [Phycisphaerales bacterium]
MRCKKMIMLLVCVGVPIVALVPGTLATSGPLTTPNEVPVTRQISVEIRLTSSGQPLSGVAFKLAAGAQDRVGKTGTDGRLVLQLEIPRELTRAAAYALIARPDSGTPEEREAAYQKEADRIRRLAFRRWYPIDLEAERASYELAIDVGPARTCSITVRDEQGRAVTAIAESSSGSIGSLALARAPGPVVVGGLPRGQASVVYVWSASCRLKRVVVPAGEGDHRMDVVMQPVNGDCEVNISLTPGSALDWRPDYGHIGVTLVSLDGMTAISLLARETADGTDRTVVRGGSAEFQRVPAGTYYAVAGSFSGTASQRAVIERALAGEDLRPLGIPTITAAPGVVAEATLVESSLETQLFGDTNTQRP